MLYLSGLKGNSMLSDLLFNRIGCLLRLLIYKLLLHKNVKYKILLKGISKPRNKRDEEFNVKNEITNRLYGIGFWILLLLLGLLFGVL